MSTDPQYIVVQLNADGNVYAWPARGHAVHRGPVFDRVELTVDHSRVVCEHQGDDPEAIADAATDAVRALCPEPEPDVEPDTDDCPTLHSIDNVVLPVPYRVDPDTGRPPHGTQRLVDFPAHATARDAEGRHFRVLHHGPVQGARVLRDPEGRAFAADIDTILAP